MTDHVFELDNFRGPLDLLLHLIREQEMDITDVDLGTLCDQYLAVIERMRDMDVAIAGEFLVMASTLVLIKSRAILPCEEVDLAEELDPADELILQLLEYRKFKSLSIELGRRAHERARRHERRAPELPAPDDKSLAEISLWDLVGSFARLVEELGLDREIHTLRAEKPVRDYMRVIMNKLFEDPRCSFRQLFDALADPSEMYAFFLALLELVRADQLSAQQDRTAGDILLELREDRDDGRLAELLQEGRAATAPSARPLASPDAEGMV